MSVLVVGGVTVQVFDDGTPQTTVEDVGGEIARMFDLSARITRRGVKRTWEQSTIWLPDATATTLKNVINGTTQPVACSGDLLGGAINCITKFVTEVTGYGVGGLMRQVRFQLIEV